MRNFIFILSLALACTFCLPMGLVAAQTTPIVGQSTGTTRVSEESFASWYGADFHGRKTSNGEIFDQTQLTAAHRTFPFGTMVRVTDLYSGKSVVVRINDRGPFVEGRSIDLSRAAAEQLGIISAGISKVLIEAEVPLASLAVDPNLNVPPTSTVTPVVFAPAQIPTNTQADPGLSQVLHSIQVASFTNSSNADKLVLLLRQRNLPANLENNAETGRTRVILRGISEPMLAETVAQLRDLGFAQVLVRPQTP